MKSTSFLLLSLFLVLVTQAAGRRPREKFQQSSEDVSSESFEVHMLDKGPGLNSAEEEYSITEKTRTGYRSEKPKSMYSEEIYEETLHKKNKDRVQGNYKAKRFQDEESESSYRNRKIKPLFTGYE
ncbi:seminal vesicle secretory protein 5-like [Nannospalax galili]|uniref:seminal vesicle secretory protein 5-like n=1 Tax=Nannospalax galili TaxID=1026970 RepID=UPI0004ED6596|nr:seminal vesicle secretory protein 5-like [Nannospalax galili]